MIELAVDGAVATVSYAPYEPETEGVALHCERAVAALTNALRSLCGATWDPDEVLLPQMNAKEAVALFDKAESEALAVVESRQAARVIGLLSEKHTLKRYSEELDRQRRASVGEVA